MHGEYRAGFTVNPVSGSKETRGFQGAKIIPSNTQNLGQGQNCPGCDKKVYMDDKVIIPSISYSYSTNPEILFFFFF